MRTIEEMQCSLFMLVPETVLAESKSFAFRDVKRADNNNSLAYLEMRLLIARLFWRFDLELQPESATWNKQKSYLLWEKPAMFVKILPRGGRT